MRTEAFELSLDEARDYPQIWRLLLGCLLIIFIYLSGAAFLIGVTIGAAGAIDPAYTTNVTAALMRITSSAQGYGGIDTPLATLIVLGTFLGFFIGPLLAAAALHFRGPGSLFGEWEDWLEGFTTALVVLVPVYAVVVGLAFWLDPPNPGLPFNRWLLLLPLAVPLIFVQTAAEELVFRGYLQQQLAARFRARWIWMGLPALIFAALHWMPSAEANLPLVLLGALVFGLLAADLTAQTGNLGAAMGLHFGNNLVALLGVATADTITGLALFVTPTPVSETGVQSISILISVTLMVLVWWLVRRRLTR
ncbi:CPBP family intramembrane glutamic endopeptidase [Tropicimonas marinistellae]|uniref:CPBP family intramembrane glutamic endopeptidase n=1 Tax=Tropicimonas marinistellae TaxID=1739787 RepID=UPI00082B4676|nr:CPBP family intramembrane glutamic endopeptidase [Tropicimonas marinistellae]